MTSGLQSRRSPSWAMTPSLSSEELRLGGP